jgi:hypothetical protein
MMQLLGLTGLCLHFLAVLCVQAMRVPEYQQLPPLREQAAIQDAWTAERLSNVPQLLRKYGVDAWLVRLPLNAPQMLIRVQMSQKEYAEDTGLSGIIEYERRHGQLSQRLSARNPLSQASLQQM